MAEPENKTLPSLWIDPFESTYGEIYRLLFSGMERRIAEKGIRSIAVTSAIKGEGKTTTAIHVARTAARDFGKRVLLVEGDLRNPQFHRHWMKPDGVGLYDVLRDHARCELAVGPTDTEGMEAMPLGNTPGAPEVSGSILAQGLKRVVRAVATRYDYIFVDSPPILPLVDMRIIAEAVDGILMVVRAEGAPRSVIAKALEAVPREKVVGVVLNGMKTAWPRYDYGYMY